MTAPTRTAGSLIHACPVGDADLTPCCDRSMFSLPMTDRVTLDPEVVTCPGPERLRALVGEA